MSQLRQAPQNRSFILENIRTQKEENNVSDFIKYLTAKLFFGESFSFCERIFEIFTKTNLILVQIVKSSVGWSFTKENWFTSKDFNQFLSFILVLLTRFESD